MDTSTKLFYSPLSLLPATPNHLHDQYVYSYCLSKSGETQQAQTCSLGGEGRGGSSMAKRDASIELALNLDGP